jgi:uncharacterized protein (DUF2235 family)
MANIIVCCDGTWNTADERDNGIPCPTNVAKIFNALADVDAQGAEQKSYYHSGVGAEGDIFEHFLGGALGDGLDKNIESAYKWLGQNYAVGDRIFIFGFSRGAYTARYVAGMVCSYGLADFATTNLSDDEIWKRAGRILDADRKNADQNTLRDIAFFDVARGAPSKDSTPVHFLGVWDTVGSLGVPSNMALLSLLDSLKPHQFQDTLLSNTVRHARHAVAIDEKRECFTPTLWSEIDKHPDAKQIWFAGVHSNVGGGYVQTGLSDIALAWMMDEAEAQQLKLRDKIREQLAPDPRGTLHDSCTGVFAPLPTLPRSAPRIGNASAPLHDSVIERWRNPPIEQSPYWRTKSLDPGQSDTVDVYARPHWNETGLYLQKGVQYEFAASGQWIDGDVKCDPNGPQAGEFHLGEIAQIAGSAWGKVEQLYQSLSHNPQARFLWTKREEKYEWFALVGVVANGAGTDQNGNPTPHESFLIGKGPTRFSPKESGYLYCYANDAWPAYGNNRGSVRLTVQR